MLSQLESLEQRKLNEWFNNMVATLRTHELMLQTDTATPQLKTMYDVFVNGSTNDIALQGKVNAQVHFVRSILIEYLSILDKNLPSKLAVYFNDSEVLVWAEISDDDHAMEKSLLVAEAKINAKYHPYGFDMETTIVEASDNLSVPNHYQSLK
jgi:hypothetical protein